MNVDQKILTYQKKIIYKLEVCSQDKAILVRINRVKTENIKELFYLVKASKSSFQRKQNYFHVFGTLSLEVKIEGKV